MWGAIGRWIDGARTGKIGVEVAVYDPESKKLVVRVVYDGPGMAGKTTNLQQLCTSFSRERRSELYTGTTLAARTLSLDWMQLDGGLVRGHDLRCHLLTVPGQVVLQRRRHMILSMADAAVFVLESTEEGLREAQPMWRSLLACTGGREGGVPVVIQANKQDMPGALSPVEIRQHWSLDPSIPIIAATAALGHGVRETVVLAIRAAAVLLQEALAAGSLADMEGTYESGPELERRIFEMERANPMSGVDVILAARQGGASGSGVLAAVVQAPIRADDPATLPAPPGPRSTDPPLASVRPVGAETERPLQVEPSVPGALGPPCLPTADVPSGLVWPELEGRKTLRRVPFAEAELKRMKRRRGRPSGRPRAAETLIYEAGIWCLKTAGASRFGSVDEAREQLVRLAHTKLDLGTLCVPRTVLVVQRDPDEAYRLWTICLWLTTLESQIAYAAEAGDEAGLAEALGHYARFVIRALRLCLDSNIVLQLHPSNLGLLCDEVFYLDDAVEKGGQLPLAGHAILRRFDEHEKYPEALRTYSEVLLDGVVSRLRPGELEMLDLARSLETAIVSTSAGKQGKDRLLRELELRGL